MPLDSEYVQDALRLWTQDDDRIDRLNNWFSMVKNGVLHRDPFAPRLVELKGVEAAVSGSVGRKHACAAASSTSALSHRRHHVCPRR